jgi:hypothetical protein
MLCQVEARSALRRVLGSDPSNATFGDIDTGTDMILLQPLSFLTIKRLLELDSTHTIDKVVARRRRQSRPAQDASLSR